MGHVVPFPENPQERRAADAELVARCLDGDLAAFDALVARYQNQVFGYACRMLGDPEMARETTQDIFLRTFRYLPRFRGEADFSTWLFTIVVSTCRNAHAHRRVRDKHRQSPGSPHDFDLPEDPMAVLPDARPGPAGILDQREAAAMLRAALNNLPEPHRQILILRDVSDFSYEQIAGILRCPAGTVKSRIARARLLLREQLLRLGYDGQGD